MVYPLNDKPLDSLKTLAVSMGLIFLHEKDTPQSMGKFSLYYRATCLCSNESLGPIEHYLYGFRDGRSVPHPDAAQALENVRTIHHELLGTVNAQHKLLTRLDELDSFIDPFTRERG